MYNNICVERDQTFAQKNMGRAGPFPVYAQYVKTKISEGLDQATLLLVLRRAGDIALEKIKAKVRALKDPLEEIEDQRTLEWCATSATKVVQEFIFEMDNWPETFARALDNARKSPGLGSD